jgi:hypothetical protein
VGASVSVFEKRAIIGRDVNIVKDNGLSIGHAGAIAERGWRRKVASNTGSSASLDAVNLCPLMRQFFNSLPMNQMIMAVEFAFPLVKRCVA